MRRKTVGDKKRRGNRAARHRVAGGGQDRNIKLIGPAALEEAVQGSNGR